MLYILCFYHITKKKQANSKRKRNGFLYFFIVFNQKRFSEGICDEPCFTHNSGSGFFFNVFFLFLRNFLYIFHSVVPLTKCFFDIEL